MIGTFDKAVFVALGKALHEKFFKVVGELHPNDDEHNAAVGRMAARCLEGDVAGAEKAYNEWASGAGYVPISLGEKGENFVVRFYLNEAQDAVVTVNRNLELVEVETKERK